MEMIKIEAAAEAPVTEARAIDYYAGARRITVGGVPQRVFQWRSREMAAQIASIETARDAGCELYLADAPLFSFVPAEGEREAVKRRGSAPVPKPSPMMREYYKGGVRIVIGGVPCRMPRPFGKNHSPRHWASLNEPMRDWSLRAAQWWMGVEEARADGEEAVPTAVQTDPIPVSEPEPVENNVVEFMRQPNELEPADDAAPAYLVRTITAEAGQVDRPFTTLAAAVAEVASMYLRREWASIHSAGVAESFSIHPHGGRYAVKQDEKPFRWAISFESDDGYKSAACRIAERCGVRYASHRRGYQASNRAIRRFAAEWDARIIRDATAPEPVQREAEPAPPATPAEAPAIVLSAAPSDDTGQSEPGPDPIAAVLARLEALEAAIAAAPLPGESAAIISATTNEGEEIIATPSGGNRAKRSPAHERAVRRAWAERSERRASERRAVYLKDRRDEAVRKAAKYRGKYAEASERMASALAAVESAEGRRWNQWDKRRRSTMLARQRGKTMVAAVNHMHDRFDAATQRASVAEAGLARLKADMADPSQPERASDIKQLLEERDAARTALSAVTARCERAEASRDQLADAMEGLISRVSIAEAAVRNLETRAA